MGGDRHGRLGGSLLLTLGGVKIQDGVGMVHQSLPNTFPIGHDPRLTIYTGATSRFLVSSAATLPGRRGTARFVCPNHPLAVVRKHTHANQCHSHSAKSPGRARDRAKEAGPTDCAIQQILGGDGRRQARRVPTRRRARKRKPMSAARKKALSQRMKAYWARRRQASGGKAVKEKQKIG